MSSKAKAVAVPEIREAGVLAEFDDASTLLAAAAEVRNAGYMRWDCHTPYPVHGLDSAMGVRATILPWIVLVGGLTGLTVAVLMQWWMNAIDYPFWISGKPLWSIPANVPIMFELMVLFAGITSFASMLVLNGLPRFYNPIFRSERFKRVTDDRFFIWIDRRDNNFNRAQGFLDTLGASAVDVVREELV